MHRLDVETAKAELTKMILESTSLDAIARLYSLYCESGPIIITDYFNGEASNIYRNGLWVGFVPSQAVMSED